MAKRGWSTTTLAATLILAAGGVALGTRTAGADGVDAADQHAQCAVRVSIALTGLSPKADLMSSSDPQGQVEALLKTPEFTERFSNYINSRFNRSPGESLDAAYYLTSEILTKDLPWKQMFLGPYDVVADDKGNVAVKAKSDGLGYFRSQVWMESYAGNEPEGLRLRAAYRIMQNVVGLVLIPSVATPGGSVDKSTRSTTPSCQGCHFNGPFALDKVAGILSRRDLDDNTKFTPPTEKSAAILDKPAVADDKAIVETLVASDEFKVQACRLAFNYLYGRDEFTCEGPLFDKCLSAFSADGKMQSALKTLAKDPAFCQ